MAFYYVKTLFDNSKDYAIMNDDDLKEDYYQYHLERGKENSSLKSDIVADYKGRKNYALWLDEKYVKQSFALKTSLEKFEGYNFYYWQEPICYNSEVKRLYRNIKPEEVKFALQELKCACANHKVIKIRKWVEIFCTVDPAVLLSELYISVIRNQDSDPQWFMDLKKTLDILHSNSKILTVYDNQDAIKMLDFLIHNINNYICNKSMYIL